jgi:hypothetical protein
MGVRVQLIGLQAPDTDSANAILVFFGLTGHVFRSRRAARPRHSLVNPSFEHRDTALRRLNLPKDQNTFRYFDLSQTGKALRVTIGRVILS